MGYDDKDPNGRKLFAQQVLAEQSVQMPPEDRTRFEVMQLSAEGQLRQEEEEQQRDAALEGRRYIKPGSRQSR